MIGFIGLGVMGEPICRNLGRKASEEVLGFDLDPAPLARLKDEGVDAAGSVREIAEHCNIVFLSLPGVPEVKNVCVGPSSLLLHMRSGGYVVDLSTTHGGAGARPATRASPRAASTSPTRRWRARARRRRRARSR